MISNISTNTLSKEEYETIRDIVYSRIGVNLTESKKPLIISRLSKRLRHLNLDSFTQYIEYLKKNKSEMEQLYNSITTNVTHFFRESRQFDYMRNVYLPEIQARATQKEKSLHSKKEIRVWSAACSTGEEAYTLAIVLNEFFSGSGWEIKILASDINTEVLKFAENAIYSEDKVKKIPYNLLKKYFKLGTGENKGYFKVKDSLRSLVYFKNINLLADDYPIRAPIDIIFCRNVFIYFNQKTRNRILGNFYKYLQPDGLLFLGHSEKIDFVENTNWSLVYPTVYSK